MTARSLSPWLVALVLTGCQGLPSLLPGTASAVGVRYGDLAFGDADLNTIQRLGGSTAVGGTAVPAAAPYPMPSAIPSAVPGAMPTAMPSGGYYGGYGYGYGPMPVDFRSTEEYVLTETSQAEAPGYRGTLLEVQSQVVAPLVAEWAGDAQLRSATGAADADGRNPVAGGEGEPPGWQFTYVSLARKEVLTFLVTSAKTVVFKQTWKPRQLALGAVTVNSSDAVAIVAKAIGDRTQSNGFLSSSRTPSPWVVMPPPAVPMPTSTPAPGPGPSPTPMPRPSIEDLYELPAETRWYVTLSNEGGREMWSVSVDPGYPSASTHAYSPGFGRVDARSGELIELRRPQRFPLPTPNVTPSPWSDPTPRPTPAP